MNALGALGKTDAARDVRLRLLQALENHLREVPEDARARILLGGMYSQEHRIEDAIRETNLAMTLRPNEATVLYNAACTFCEPRPRGGGDRRAAQGLGGGLPGRRAGRAATPTSRASTATRSSKGSSRAEGRVKVPRSKRGGRTHSAGAPSVRSLRSAASSARSASIWACCSCTAFTSGAMSSEYLSDSVRSGSPPASTTL